MKAKEKRGGNAARYEDLIRENEAFFSLDLMKESLSHACKLDDEIASIMEFCQESGNSHLQRFGRIAGQALGGDCRPWLLPYLVWPG